MGKVTGKPRGRPPGSLNKRTAAAKQAAATARAHIEATVPDAFTGDAHAFLMTVYKDPRQTIELRLEAAGKAIRYEKPALAAVEMNATIKRDADDFSDAELAAIIAEGRGGTHRH